jgi:hypothetical protein
MALNMMTRKVQGVSALSRPSAGVLCSPKVTVTRRGTIMRYKEDEVRTGHNCLLTHWQQQIFFEKQDEPARAHWQQWLSFWATQGA